MARNGRSHPIIYLLPFFLRPLTPDIPERAITAEARITRYTIKMGRGERKVEDVFISFLAASRSGKGKGGENGRGGGSVRSTHDATFGEKRRNIGQKKEEEEDAAKRPIQRREAIRISLFLAVERMKKWLHPPLSLSSAVVPKVGELLFLLPPPSSSVQSPLGGIHGGLRNPICAPCLLHWPGYKKIAA